MLFSKYARKEKVRNFKRTALPGSTAAIEPKERAEKNEPVADFGKPASFEIAAALVRARGKTSAEAVREAAAKHPELHKAYLARINSGGANVLAKMLAEAALLAGSPAPANGDAVIPRGDGFVAKVDDFQQKKGCGRLEATQAVRRLYPDAHSIYLQAANQSRRQDAHGQAGPQPENGEDFMALVRAYEYERFCGRTEAIKAVRKKYPEKHAAYLRSVNGR